MVRTGCCLILTAHVGDQQTIGSRDRQLVERLAQRMGLRDHDLRALRGFPRIDVGCDLLGDLVEPSCEEAGVRHVGEGVEISSGRQTPDQVAQLTRLAREQGLQVSVGSDFHREGTYFPDVGVELPRLEEGLVGVWQRFLTAGDSNPAVS